MVSRLLSYPVVAFVYIPTVCIIVESETESEAGHLQSADCLSQTHFEMQNISTRENSNSPRRLRFTCIFLPTTSIRLLYISVAQG